MSAPLHPPFVPLDFERLAPAEMLRRARELRAELARRRSVRHFAPDPLPEGLLEECLLTAGSAPSGAHRQPWTFVVVRDPELKRRIREAAEEEERKLYEERISDEWRAALAPLGTDANKPFLEIAPALIVVFRRAHELENGEKRANYYTQESVGLACGFLLAALHHAGLATLTHTPSPMGFLSELLERPENERPFLLIPVGYPAAGCEVPNLERKSLAEISLWR
ncbi:MAG: nitroreductase family protein [Planctomycetes bacterium]|nr:nitroreductase family protein [Planctomycetota bacterium]